ncbi:MAG: hypothetical protein KF708_19915 [Pirellulales bacterium]|nr:hypothetical protein [Pirellulales bacterium]
MTLNYRLFPTAIVLVLTLVTHVRAESIGFTSFGNFSEWEINQGDGGSAPTISIANDRIQITNALSSIQRRSMFHKTPQPISYFEASYVYQNVGVSGNVGLTFVIQNSNAGIDALGNASADLGYATSINKSIALTIELDSNGRAGLFQNGSKSGLGSLTSPLNLSLGNPIAVNISYDGLNLTHALTDTVTLDKYSVTSQINIPSIVGSSHAFVGFTASTGNAPRNQFVSHPNFLCARTQLALRCCDRRAGLGGLCRTSQASSACPPPIAIRLTSA